MTEAYPLPNSILRRSDEALSTKVGDELLMMSVLQGKYFNLNDVGTRIWELLAEPITLDDLVVSLTAEYKVEADTARREVERFLIALRERDLLDDSSH
ncbi:PqqD family peptide modification chaperone [Methylomonas fluvii]|uniref:PqqD family protein n=1 Tax=Methylomonas fluvii TaxID=1854564 RepID=A0ABR9DHM4_9GAMM|nr:PqqD family peptide modification chaperone [Methylomonas fluvii]MBD9362425.1 PqqD family protein [Methylomonas fluvii]